MKRTHALLTGTLLVACTSAPRDPGPSPAPPTAPTPTASDARPDPRTPQQPLPGTLPAARARTAKLDTGLSLVLTTLPPSHDALVQFGLLAGASAQAPGLAELTMHALLSSADASRGRPSLQAAIGSLGGTARVHGGLNSTWLELRVPGAKWSLAVQALRQALGAPQQSRHQLERVRDDLVAATVAAVAADPLGTMARQLLLGSDDTAAHCNDLIDRDAGEIGSFQARVLRPDRCVLAVDAPETSDRLLARLRSETEGFATWKPTATDPTELTNIERPFVGGIHWAPDGTDGPCRVALVIALPDLNRPDAAAAFLLHACITMDGNGGRFEQLLRERGLNGVHWRSEIVNTAEAAALVLRTEVTATDAVALWRTWTLARQSLGDVAPTAEERAFARRRAPLSARLQLLDAGSRSRTTARLARAERSLETLDAAFAALDADGGAAVLAATDYYRSLPSALVVLGGDPPPDLTEVRKFSPLQKGLAATAQAPTATTNAPETASATPWLERAIEAIGGRDRLLRLQGWRSECRIGTERAPGIGESIEWNTDGTLTRTREVLGQTIKTTLLDNTWSEQMGDKTTTLEPREAAQLRSQQRHHPLALLAAHTRGELPFKVVSQRNVGDRDLMVLEAASEHAGRLRLHLDTESCLVRIVEVWETLPDGTPVHVHDAWSDYRSTQGLRAPFHRLSTQDDGQNRIEATFTRWLPKLR